MTAIHHSNRPYRLFGILWVTRRCEALISDLLVDECGIPKEAIQHGFHLTVYESRRPIPGVAPTSQAAEFYAETSESRFMVLAPGGENPRPELEPRRRSVGIRLTKRNRAIEPILNLRRDLYRRETQETTKNRKATTDWTNAFGARGLAGKPLAGFCTTPIRRITVAYGVIVYAIRFKNPSLHR